MTPVLLKEIFEAQIERPMDAPFLPALAHVSSRRMPAGFRRVQIGLVYRQSRALWVAARLDLASAYSTTWSAT